MDYYMNPRRKVGPDFQMESNESYYHHSKNCVDEITLIKLRDKNDYRYKAVGCAVFLSSTDIFLEEAEKKEFKDMANLSNSFVKLINQIDMNEDE